MKHVLTLSVACAPLVVFGVEGSEFDGEKLATEWQGLFSLCTMGVRWDGTQELPLSESEFEAACTEKRRIERELRTHGWCYEGYNVSYILCSANAVQNFYMALAAGDGDAASLLIIPEKRSKGPLSAGPLTEFYGNLKTPLNLIELRPLSDHAIEVSYNYEMANGFFCKGKAIANTVIRNNDYLIESITASNGC